MPPTYHSKIDWWLLVILVAAIVVGVFGCLSAVMAGGGKTLWVALPTAVFAIGLPVWVLLSTRYTLDGGVLVARSGPFKWKIPVAEISAITPTRNPLSSPALSLDRLRIDYGSGKRIMVSPEDKERFIADLEAARRSAVSSR